MSDAAKTRVKACTHPQVKGATRKLFEAIADHIPEGHTTTPIMDMDNLAARARIHRRTVVTRLPRLIAIGEIRVLDGGQGSHYARYTMVHLDGEAPATNADLPLVGLVTPPRPRSKEPSESATPTLFDDPAFDRSQVTKVRRNDRSQVITSWLAQVITTITSWLAAAFDRSQVTKVRRNDRSQVITSTEGPTKRSITSDHKSLPLDGTYYLKERTTTTTARASPDTTSTKPPPCRWLGTVHAWCSGRFHMPMQLHVEIRNRLARRPGETTADLDAQLFARYADVIAGIPDEHDLPDEDDFTFWKRMLRPSAAERARSPSGESRPPIPDNDLFARAAEERRQRYGGGS